MFSNLIIYRIADQTALSAMIIEDALQKTPFLSCGPTQEQSAGWIPPRGEENGALCENVGGQYVLRFMSEAKILPASVLNRKVQEKADAIEKEFGRKPGKKEKRDLKDEAKLDLLPMAFTKQGSTWVWINPQARFLVIDTASQGKADEIVTLLVEAIKGMGVALIDTQSSAQSGMAHWLLSQEAPVGFSIDRQCTLQAADESKAIVRYTRHALDIDEVKQHIQHGKLPTSLAMTWDDRVSFVLTDGLTLKSLAFTDTVLDQAGDEGGFDTDVAIATGELAKMIPAVIEALGGEGRTSLGENSFTFKTESEGVEVDGKPLPTLAVRIACMAKHMGFGLRDGETVEIDGKVVARGGPPQSPQPKRNKKPQTPSRVLDSATGSAEPGDAPF